MPMGTLYQMMQNIAAGLEYTVDESGYKYVCGSAN